MLKYTFETNDQELKTWVDPETGSLNVQVDDETVNIPYEIGAEMIAVLKHKQSIYEELARKKESAWKKFLDLFSKSEGSTYTELPERKFKAA